MYVKEVQIFPQRYCESLQIKGLQSCVPTNFEDDLIVRIQTTLSELCFKYQKNATSLIPASQALLQMLETIRKKKFEIPRWPSELPANQCRPVSPLRQIGRHYLAGNSEVHRGISKKKFPMLPCTILEAMKLNFGRSHFLEVFVLGLTQ